MKGEEPRVHGWVERGGGGISIDRQHADLNFSVLCRGHIVCMCTHAHNPRSKLSRVFWMYKVLILSDVAYTKVHLYCVVSLE